MTNKGRDDDTEKIVFGWGKLEEMKKDAKEYKPAFCTKCGRRCKWIELISSKFWGCPKCG